MNVIDQEGKTIEEALAAALKTLNKTEDEVEYEVLEEGSKGILGMGAKPVLIRVRVKEPQELTKAKDLLYNILQRIGIESTIEPTVEGKTITLNIDSVDSGILIGKHGQTLEALQYLINQILMFEEYKVILDISDYRRRHKDRIVEITQKIATQVRRTNRRITLRPMSAVERKIVHEVVQGYGDLTSSSIGSDPNRRVVISSLRRNVKKYSRSSSSKGRTSGRRFSRGKSRGTSSRYSQNKYSQPKELPIPKDDYEAYIENKEPNDSVEYSKNENNVESYDLHEKEKEIVKDLEVDSTQI